MGRMQNALSRRTIDMVSLVMVLCACGWILSYPLRSQQGLLAFAQDDFYYYLKPAQSLAAGHAVTFDGTTLTNGFHPLYFVLLTMASTVIHSLRGIFVFLWTIDVLSATAIFVLLRAIYARLTRSVLLANALSVCILLPCLRTIFMQMEVTLALPLGFALLWVAFAAPERFSSKRCALLGLLGALTLLARLDAGILVFALLVGFVLIPSYRVIFTIRNMAAFSASALPLPMLYFGINRFFFHQWLPISGAAKQLRHGWYPSAQVLTSFHGTNLLVICLAVACVPLAVAMRKQLSARVKLFCFTVFITPALFFGIEMFVSDWKLWGWYFYQLRFAWSGVCLFGLVLLSSRGYLSRLHPRLHFARSWVPAALYAVSFGALFTSHYKVDGFMVEIEQAAQRLQAFEISHPGRYAMGDRAGMFGYLSRSPVLQAEGLMMDAAYLQHIKKEEDLRTVLDSYNIAYYVSFTETIKESGSPCFQASEPVIAGPDALRMRSEFCEQPVAEFQGFDGTYRIFHLLPDTAGKKNTNVSPAPGTDLNDKSSKRISAR